MTMHILEADKHSTMAILVSATIKAELAKDEVGPRFRSTNEIFLATIALRNRVRRFALKELF